MRPVHALVALLVLTGLVVASLFLSKGRTPHEDSPFVYLDPREIVLDARPTRLADEPSAPEPQTDEFPPGPDATARDDEIVGRIVDAPPQELGRLEVHASSTNGSEPVHSVACAPDGRFTLSGLRPEGIYNLRVFPAGQGSFARSRTGMRTAKSGGTEVMLRWLPDLALIFQVADARTGRPLEDFEARLGRGFARPLLDEDGRIRRRFPEGRVRWVGWVPEETREPVQLIVSARGYRELRADGIVAPIAGDLRLGRLVLEPVPRLVVRVLEEGDQVPIEGALVSLRHALDASVGRNAQTFDPYSGRTDAEGRVLLSCNPGEDAVLRVQHAGHVEATREVLLSLAEEQHETVRLALLR